ncbi:hypothetical protein ACOMHN_006586 [Nucella lapillus]
MDIVRKDRSPGVVFVALCLLMLMQLWRGEVKGEIKIPGLPKKKFDKRGDINIGFVFGMSGNASGCNDVFNRDLFETYPEVVSFAVDHVNKNEPLPRGLKLGFVGLDDCSLESVASVQSLAFVPQTTCRDAPASAANEADIQEHYDVVAVVGSYSSTQTVAMAEVLAAAQTPHMSVMSTSDELSDRTRYPYFLRLIGPDKYQFEVIYQTLKFNGWTYVSVLYEEGSFGESGYKRLKGLFEKGSICQAVVDRLPERAHIERIREVASLLLRDHGNSRVVVLILRAPNTRQLISAVADMSPNNHFIWVGPDSWARHATRLTELAYQLADSLVVTFRSAPIPGFNTWFNGLKPSATSNPWFGENWEHLFNCSLEKTTCDETLTRGDAHTPMDPLTDIRGYIMDTISFIAKATSKVLQSNDCASLRGHAARMCIKGPRLLQALLTTQKEGLSGSLQLDAHGERHISYELMQLRLNADNKLVEEVISEYHTDEDDWTFMSNITWNNTTLRPGSLRPESLCSYPCKGHEARIVQQVFCCWKCEPCENNERLIKNGTSCELCPPFTWPDDARNKTTCALIPPTVMRFNNVAGYVQISVALFCIVVCIFVFVFFTVYRERRVIKASSLHLSHVMLFAIFMGYVDILVFMSKPSGITCRINFLLFSFSFALIYGPLLLRTLWIYRIFEAGMKCKQRPPMTDVKHQLLFSFFILFVQVVFIGVTMVVYPQWSKLTEISRHVAYVEHTCNFPHTSLICFLIYNMLLVIVCAVLAVKTRHLPDNFNESGYISKCVCTSLIIYICFTPTYVVTNRQLVRMVILVMVLFLNHSIALVFLFLPKIYAVLFIPTREVKATVVVATTDPK